LFKFAARIRRQWLVAIGFIVLILSVMWVTNYVTIYGQIFQPSQTPTPSTTASKSISSSSDTTTEATSFVAHGVRITSPVKGQQVPIGILTVTGTSKDNATTDCHVFVIVNGVKPYQNATATGPGGATDYSKWSFTLSPKYTLIKEGMNKIATKFSCKPNPAIASFYSVNVTGTRTGVKSPATISVPPPA
jgi:hypothetical protein